MKKKILFIQGGGNGGFEADTKLAASLQTELGSDYKVKYPQMLNDETLPDFGWLQQLGKEIEAARGEVILAGHSLGASMLLKYISENKIKKKIAGIFLVSTPFWSGEEDWVQGFKLQENFADKLPKNIPIFFYHCKDDEEISFDHLAFYRRKIPWANFREIKNGGHQLNNDLSPVAEDIQSL